MTNDIKFSEVWKFISPELLSGEKQWSAPWINWFCTLKKFNFYIRKMESLMPVRNTKQNKKKKEQDF